MSFKKFCVLKDSGVPSAPPPAVIIPLTSNPFSVKVFFAPA